MSIKIPILAVAATVAASAIIAAPAHAQILASPRGSVSQTIDGTRIDVDYGRPSLKGREGLFGGQIFWGHVWTPGADQATTLEINKDIMIDSVAVPAGKYSVWFVVAEGDWEMILNPNWDLYHIPEPERADDQISIWVQPDTTAPVTETLTFDFPSTEALATTLRFRWERKEVSVRIDVPSTLQLDVSEDEIAEYTGQFHTQVFKTDWSPVPYEFDMTFSYHDEAFWAAMQWSPPGEGTPSTQDLRLAPRVPQIFYPVWFRDGKIAASANFYFEFVLGDEGRAASFELRTPDDELWMRGTRVE